VSAKSRVNLFKLKPDREIRNEGRKILRLKLPDASTRLAEQTEGYVLESGPRKKKKKKKKKLEEAIDARRARHTRE